MRLVMMGTGTFAEPTFHALLSRSNSVVGLITQPKRPGGQERGSTRQTGQGMAAIALAHGVPVFQPESVSSPEGVAGIRALQPDLLVVAAYGQILSKEVLAVPAHGGINVHASLLPKYRGTAAPVAWAVFNGESRTGVTIIRMTTGLDAGDMLAQAALDIGSDETAGELEARLAPLGGRLALHVIEQLAAGTARGISQDKSQVTKAPKLTKDHGLIDWSRTATEVRNHVRAMQPWPTAYAFLHQEKNAPTRVIVYRMHVASKLDFAAPDAEPGIVLVPGAEPRLAVATGADGAVEILDLQPAGKRRMSAGEFLHGHRPSPGDQFGPESP